LAVTLVIVFVARVHQQKPVASASRSADSQTSLAAVAEIKNELSEANQRKQNLEEELKGEKAESAELAKQVNREQAALTASLGEAQTRQQVIEDLKQQLEAVRAKEKDGESELDRVKAANGRDVIAARYEIQE